MGARRRCRERVTIRGIAAGILALCSASIVTGTGTTSVRARGDASFPPWRGGAADGHRPREGGEGGGVEEELFAKQALLEPQDGEEPRRREHAPWAGEEKEEEDGARSDRDEAARVEPWRGGTAAANRPPRGAWGEGMGREEEFRGQQQQQQRQQQQQQQQQEEEAEEEEAGREGLAAAAAGVAGGVLAALAAAAGAALSSAAPAALAELSDPAAALSSSAAEGGGLSWADQAGSADAGRGGVVRPESAGGGLRGRGSGVAASDGGAAGGGEGDEAGALGRDVHRILQEEVTPAPVSAAIPDTEPPVVAVPTTEAPVSPALSTDSPVSAVLTTEAPVSPALSTDSPISPVLTTEAPISPVLSTEPPASATTDAPAIPTTDPPVSDAVPSTDPTAIPATDPPAISTTDSPDISTTDSPAISTTDSPAISTTDSPAISTTDSPAISTAEPTVAAETTPNPVVEGSTTAPSQIALATLAQVEDETPAPATTDLTPTVLPTPSVEETTVAPSADDEEATPTPTSEATTDGSSSPAPSASPAPTVEGATPAPTVDGSTAAGVTLQPGETLAPGATVAPVATLAPGETLAPGATFAPVVTLAPGETLAPGDTRAPSLAVDGETPSPSESVTAVPVTASPTDAMSEVEEALDTTGEVASTTATVAVATTAAAATVAATTATTTVATTAATSTVTTTVSTVASAAATGGGTGGTSGAVTTTTATTATTATGATGGTTTGATMTTTGGFAPDGSSAATNNAGTSGANNTNTLGGYGSDPSSVSTRSPGATLGLLMVFQMQFVSLLRMMEANITTPFMNFLDSLKWMNLHFEVDISFLSCDDEETRFNWSNDDNGSWALNTFLVFSILLVLIILHILLVSYLEAAWLSQANAIHRHRLAVLRQRSSDEAAAPFDGRTEAAYAKYLDAQNHDRDLYEQERVSTERFLKRHQSVWMYFPHVELLFLLFAYQGASAAEARMIYSGCFPLVVMGVCALIVFPVLMFIYVSRIVWSRVRPDNSPLRYEPNPNAGKGCFLFKACGGFCKAWTSGSSMFEWADKGQWASKNNEDVDLDSRKFRIGFEPLFVDYTQKGTLYVTFLLFEWLSFGLIAGFVTNGTIQTGAVCFIYVLDFLILVCLKPFSNSIIQCFTTMTVLADAITLGLMFYATFLEPDDDDDADRLELVYAGALSVQTLAILFFVIPLYLDAFITIVGTLCKKCSQLAKGTTSKFKAPIKGSSSETASIFFALVRENFSGCVKSTWRGPTYNPVQTELQRRRSSLLLPEFQEGQSSDEETANPHFGKRPSGPVHPTGPRRHAGRSPTTNALEDFSNHGPDGQAGTVSHQRGRSSASTNSRGTASARSSSRSRGTASARTSSHGGSNAAGSVQRSRGSTSSVVSGPASPNSTYSRSSSAYRGRR